MSNLCAATGDDYPNAAAKHLDDAAALFQVGRHDGAGYLAGYVVECALKTLIVIEEIAKEARLTPATLAIGMNGASAPDAETRLDKGLKTARKLRHRLDKLSEKAADLAALPGTATARYGLPSQTSGLHRGGWRETIRYRGVGHVTSSSAEAWLNEARDVYRRTVGELRRDGVVF